MPKRHRTTNPLPNRQPNSIPLASLPDPPLIANNTHILRHLPEPNIKIINIIHNKETT